MISEERLKQLWEEKRKIYYCSPLDDINTRLLGNKHHKLSFSSNNVTEYVFVGRDKVPAWSQNLCRLFETEEEATEYLKYGNVTRTQKLELPIWKDVEEAIEKAGNGTYIVAKNKDFSLSVEVNTPVVSVISLFTATEYYNWNYNKENYHKALDIAIRLWKGEEW